MRLMAFETVKRVRVCLAAAAMPPALGLALFGIYHLRAGYAIEITPAIADIGTIRQGERRNVEVRVYNRSDRIITVVPSAKSSCSCVKTVGAATDLLPGESAPFTVLVDTATVPGRWQRQALFQISGVECEETLVASSITANVLPEYSLLPTIIHAAPGKKTRVEIVPGYRSDIRIEHAYASLPNIRCRVADDGRAIEVQIEPLAGEIKTIDSTHVIVTTTSEIQPSRRIYIRF